MQILTHRALDPDIRGFPKESSFAGFKNHLNRGFGIEFDVYFMPGQENILISHEPIRQGSDLQNICILPEIMELISKSDAALHALHFKGKFQNEQFIHRLISELKNYRLLHRKLLIFDLYPKSAEIFKNYLPEIHRGASVAHQYDIARFNPVVENTLLTLESVCTKNSPYDFVWLDEWDRKDNGGKEKTFYNAKTFNILRHAGLNIALVTPELHGTSPGLLGGEMHEDAESNKKLFSRIRNIISLNPDAICTDHPDKVLSLLDSIP